MLLLLPVLHGVFPLFDGQSSGNNYAEHLGKPKSWKDQLMQTIVECLPAIS